MRSVFFLLLSRPIAMHNFLMDAFFFPADRNCEINNEKKKSKDSCIMRKEIFLSSPAQTAFLLPARGRGNCIEMTVERKSTQRVSKKKSSRCNFFNECTSTHILAARHSLYWFSCHKSPYSLISSAPFSHNLSLPECVIRFECLNSYANFLSVFFSAQLAIRNAYALKMHHKTQYVK